MFLNVAEELDHIEFKRIGRINTRDCNVWMYRTFVISTYIYIYIFIYIYISIYFILYAYTTSFCTASSRGSPEGRTRAHLSLLSKTGGRHRPPSPVLVDEHCAFAWVIAGLPLR